MRERRALKVAHVTPAYYPAVAYGGPPRSVHGLTQALANGGASVRVLTTNAHGLDTTLDVDTGSEIELAPGLQVRYARRIFMHSVSPALLIALRELICWSDVVHLTAVYNFTTFPTLALARRLGKPLVWTPRGALQRWSGTRRVRAKAGWNSVCSVLLPKNAALHVTSPEEGDAVRAVLPRARVEVIPNGIRLPAAPFHRDDGAKLRLLFLGRLDPIKGIERLIDACALVSERRSSFSLSIAGAGPENYVATLRARVERTGLSDRVRFLGPVDDAEKLALFAEHDLLVMPSFQENFGLAAAEALAHEVPVIASHGTPWSILDDLGCGAWVENTPVSLRDAILTLWDADRRSLGRAGRAWAARELSWDSIADRMLKLYEELAR